MASRHDDLANAVGREFGRLPMVEAVAIGGSRGAGTTAPDPASDLDILVFTRADIPLAARESIVTRTGGASRADLDLRFWGPGDEWLTAEGDVEVDVTYFGTDWIVGQIDRVLLHHEPSLGYSTCFWHTVATCRVLEDPAGWLTALQRRCRVPYPEALRANIVTLNRPVLRDVIPSFAGQLAKVAVRRDLVSVNHRLAGLLASYFDILFAFNRATHPGEKRLLEACRATCARLPEGMAADVDEILESATTDLAGLGARVDRLIDRLEALLDLEPWLGGGRVAGPQRV
jgi:hypothetical protein